MDARPAPSRFRRHAWRVVGASFVSLGLAYGIWYCYSVFLVAFIREFGWDRSLLAGAFSVFVLVHGLLSPVLGWLAARLGPRRLIVVGACTLGIGLLLAAQSTRWWHLYLAFGVIVAAGTAAAGWVPSVILIRAWFPAQIGTALGLASAGIGVGIFALVPFTQFMIERMGWRWTFRILAGVVVFWVVPATLWLVRDPDSGGPSGFGSEPRPVAAESEGHWTLRAALGAWRFWGTAAVFFSGNVATQMLLVHQVAYLVDHGVPALVAASVGGVVGLSSIAGKTGWGTLSDRVGRELAYTLSFACVVASLGVLALAGRYPASVLPYLYAALIGLGYAATGPLTPAVASDLFGGRRFSAIFGTLHIANSLGTASGAWVAGEIFDRTRSYAGALWLALAMAVLAPALLWIVAPRRPNPPPGSGEKAHAR